MTSEIAGSVYGLQVHGRLPEAFRSHLLGESSAAAGSEPDRRLRIDLVQPGRLDPFGGPEIWSWETENGGRFAVHRPAERDGDPSRFGLVVDDLGRGRFRCAPDAMTVEWSDPGTGAPHYLFTYALPLWLETRGVPVLHASAVAARPDPGSPAVGFLAPTGTGKSVLCAELLSLGCRFVADDGLALRPRANGTGGADRAWWCSPGPPLLRLWPSGLERRLRVESEPLPRVHETLDKRRLEVEVDGASADRPLAAIYVLRRRPEATGGVEVGTLSPREGLVHLLEHGIAAAPAAALGFAASRLDLLADLAAKVPIRTLTYPSGTDTAARILEAIRSNIET